MFQKISCKEPYGHEVARVEGWLCANCPRISADLDDLRNSSCTQVLLKKRQEDRERLKEKLREEAKQVEKLKLLKMLEDERANLQKILMAKKQKSNFAFSTQE